MIVYQKRLMFFLVFLILFSIGFLIIFGVFDDIQELRETRGLIVPEHFFGGGSISAVGSSIMISFFGIIGIIGIILIYAAYKSLGAWARITPQKILILNEQGVYTWRLKLGTVIPWRDVEGYEVVVDETSSGIKFKRLIFKIKNKEQYVKKKWTGLYPDVAIGLFSVTETPEAICQYIDNALAGRLTPSTPQELR